MNTGQLGSVEYAENAGFNSFLNFLHTGNICGENDNNNNKKLS